MENITEKTEVKTEVFTNRIELVEKCISSYCAMLEKEGFCESKINLKDYINLCLNPNYYGIEDINEELNELEDDQEDEDGETETED